MASLSVTLPQALRRPALPLLLLLLSSAAIAVNSTAFAGLYALQWKPLPYADAERLVTVRARLDRFDVVSDFSPGFRDALAANRGPWTAVAGYRIQLDERDDGSGGTWRVVAADAALWPTLGVSPTLGRAFTADEAAAGADVVVLSHAAWRARLAGDPAVLGRMVRLDGRALQVIGVMPPGFAFPDAGVEAWLPQPPPIGAAASSAAIGETGIVARLADDASPDAAQAAAQALLAADPSLARLREWAGLRAVVRPLRELWSGVDLRALALLQGAALLLLGGLVANLVNLVHARVLRQARDLRTRAALGASLGRLVRGAVAEVAWPVALGGALALALVPAGAALLRAQGLLPVASPLGVGGDLPTLGFALLLALLLVAVAAVAAAVSVRRLRPGDAPGVGGARGAIAHRTRYGLVAAQFVLGTAILGAGALLLRSVHLLGNEDLGFARANLVVVGLDLRGESAAAAPAGGPEAFAPAYRRLHAALGALPGVQQVGAGLTVPFGAAQAVGRLRHPTDGRELQFRRADVDAGYLPALGVPVIAGPGFAAGDTGSDALQPAVVDARFASRYFPDVADPAALVGRTLQVFGSEESVRIVGIARAVRSTALDREDELPTLYRLRAEVAPLAYFVLRTAGDPAPLVAAARATVAREAPDATVLDVASMDMLVARTLADRVGLMRGVALFALLAVALSCFGLYAVLAFVVGERVAEFALRIAVGARAGRLAARVVARALGLAMLALPIGALAGILLVRASGAALHRISATDAATWAAVAVAMLCLAAAAALLPAWRAARIEPSLALRRD